MTLHEIDALARAAGLGSMLFCRGFLLTRAPESLPELPPSLAAWPCHSISGVTLRVHPAAPWYQRKRGSSSWLLLGNVVNPVRRTGSAAQCLEDLILSESRGQEQFLQHLDELTGRFLLVKLDESGGGTVWQDAAGLKPIFWVSRAGVPVHLASHSALLGEMMGLERSTWVERLVNSPMYRIGIRHLPGVATPFEGLDLLTPNTCLDLRTGRTNRFYPRKPLDTDPNVDDVSSEVGELLARTAELLLVEHRPWLSLSMGTDSRVGLVATRDVAEYFRYFSYISTKAEENDARGAAQMASRLGLKHRVIETRQNRHDDSKWKAFKYIMKANQAGVRAPSPGELRKILTLAESCPNDMLEVKGHVSEVARLFYCKKQGRASMPAELRSRDMSNLYKRNLLDRPLLQWMDESFARFKERTSFGVGFHNYGQDDMFYWEHRMGQWASFASQDHDVVHDMSSLYNNRVILELLLSLPREDRLRDSAYRRIAEQRWPEVLRWPLTVERNPRTTLRTVAERVFFEFNRWT